MKHFYTTLMAIFLAGTLLAQEHQYSITGKIQDEYGEALIGATILIEGTTNGTIADLEGKFSLQTDQEQGVLVISYIGYTSINREFQFPLAEYTMDLGTISLADMDLGIISCCCFYTYQIPDPEQAHFERNEDFFLTALGNQEILGGMSGISNGQSIISANHAPGADYAVGFRGFTPVNSMKGSRFLWNGMPVDPQYMRMLFPTNINRFRLHKGPLYLAWQGTDGNGGAFEIEENEITTNHLFYENTIGFSQAYSGPEMANAEALKNYANAHGMQGLNGNEDQNWSEKLLRTGLQQGHNLSYGKSRDNHSIKLNLGYGQQQGVVQETGTDIIRAQVRTRHEFMNDRLVLNSQILGAQIQDQFLPVFEQNGINGNAWFHALKANPTLDEKGLGFDPVKSLENGLNTRKLQMALARVDIKAKLTDWLDWNTQILGNLSGIEALQRDPLTLKENQQTHHTKSYFLRSGIEASKRFDYHRIVGNFDLENSQFAHINRNAFRSQLKYDWDEWVGIKAVYRYESLGQNQQVIPDTRTYAAVGAKVGGLDIGCAPSRSGLRFEAGIMDSETCTANQMNLGLDLNLDLMIDGNFLVSIDAYQERYQYLPNGNAVLQTGIENYTQNRGIEGNIDFTFYGIFYQKSSFWRINLSAAYNQQQSVGTMPLSSVLYPISLRNQTTTLQPSTDLMAQFFPDFSLSLFQALNIEDWTFSMNIQGIQGLQQMDQLSILLANEASLLAGNNLPLAALQNEALPKTAQYDASFMASGDFIRLQNLDVRYRVPIDNITNGNKRLMVFLRAENLVNWTPKGQNLTTVSTGALTSPVNLYPMARTFMMGIKMDLI